MITYIAFLRGINVGGNHQISMSDLKKLFEGCGMHQVTTVLNSGNVIFQADSTNQPQLEQTIQQELSTKLGYPLLLMLRSAQQLTDLVAATPFKGMTIHKNTRSYITFLQTEADKVIPQHFETPEKDLVWNLPFSHTVASRLLISSHKRTTELMKLIEQKFGKNSTTRNWNTIMRIVKIITNIF